MTNFIKLSEVLLGIKKFYLRSLSAFVCSELLQAAERINSGEGSGTECLEPEPQSLPESGNFSCRTRISQGHTEKQRCSKAGLGKRCQCGSSGLGKQPLCLMAQEAGSVPQERQAQGTVHAMPSSAVLRCWQHTQELAARPGNKHRKMKGGQCGR